MTIRIADHPRAVRSIARIRSLAGLIGFVIGAYLAHGAGLPAFDVVLRALLTGVGLHCVGWLAALAYWKAAIYAELEAARARREQELAEAADRVMRMAAEAAAAGETAQV
jgi:hypothetical protein